ncbi:MAG: hypothetical protein ACP5QO_01945 [Clostridia bacterium]
MGRRNRRRTLTALRDAKEPLNLSSFEEEVAAEIGLDLHQDDILQREEVEAAETKD